MPAIHFYICRDFPEKTAGESHRLLQKATAAYYAGIDCSLPDLTLNRAEGGKPFFLHAPDLHFSISHSGGIWVCAFSSSPVGIDLQQIKPIRQDGIARRFFHPDEIAYLDVHPDAFFALWTAKESYVKLTGQGVAAGFSRVSVISRGEFSPPPPAHAMVHIPFDEGYVLCLCGDTAEFCLHELE